MNVLLYQFNSVHNEFLEKIINSYQDYFIFKKNKNTTLLYLNTKILKHYLKNGLDIKHRKFIFLFLRNSNYASNNIKYKFNIQNRIQLEKNNLDNFDLLNDIDYNNLKILINLSYSIIHKNNKVIIKDKNILKLENKLYINIELERFYSYKIKDKYFKYNGIIINYNNYFKNKLFPIFSIEYIHNYEVNDENKLKNLPIKYNTDINSNILHTKCNLILTNKNNVDEWIKILTKCLSKNICIINYKKDFTKILNENIFQYDYLILNYNLINLSFFKNYFIKYQSSKNIDIKISIDNSIHENIYNENIYNNNFFNIYLFKWNNIIYDDIEYIKNIDKYNFINYIECTKTKYYILYSVFENNIADYLIKNNIIHNNYNYDNNNFYSFIKNELMIYDNNINIENIYIDIEFNKDEQNLCKNIELDLKNECKKNSLFFINNYKYNFNNLPINDINNSIDKYYNHLIEIENNKMNHLNYFESIPYIQDIREKFKNNIVSYTSTNLYIKNILHDIEFLKKDFYCTICLDNIKHKNIALINCGHYFCKSCIRKYMYEDDFKKYECPICRKEFKNNNIYMNQNNNEYFGTKINKILEIIKNEHEKNIIIVTNYKENIFYIKNYIKNNIQYHSYHLFFKNNLLKEKNIKLFNKVNDVKNILFTDYDNILKYSYNITSILFIDIEYDKYVLIKNNFKYHNNNNIKFYFLYMKDTFEEDNITKIIKYVIK